MPRSIVACFFVMTVTLWSHGLGRVIEVPLLTSLNAPLVPGAPLLVSDSYTKVYLDTVELSRWPQRHLYFGVWGLRQEKPRWLHGRFNASLGEDGAVYWFRHRLSPRKKALRQKNEIYELKLSRGDRKTASTAHNILDELPRQLHSSQSDIQGDCLEKPLSSKVVSKFASPRRLPSQKVYRHTGVDLRARNPKEIRSIGKGKVYLRQKLPVYGNSLLIDHGGGLFSGYFHLKEFLRRKNEPVGRSQVVALSGKTGRVEAAHLHWEILWKGFRANPLAVTKALECP